jgi:hypothetical protein
MGLEYYLGSLRKDFRDMIAIGGGIISNYFSKVQLRLYRLARL